MKVNMNIITFSAGRERAPAAVLHGSAYKKGKSSLALYPLHIRQM
jgi:hypothetical protein